MIVRRGDVWLVAADPPAERDSRTARPFVVVSPPELHDHLRTVIAAPLAEGVRSAPFRLALRFRGQGALLVLDQLRTLDKSRLVHRTGTLTSTTMKAALTALQHAFAP